MFNHGWLDTRHSFSFAEYYDPRHMGFRQLRVINEDRVAGGAGFPPHPHQDMEIISYIVSGGLMHRDSTGSGSIVRAGEVQRMTAGRGVIHSEFNASAVDPVHFLQIWITPDRQGLEPGYEQKTLDFDAAPDQWVPVVSGNGGRGAMKIHQDVEIMATRLSPEATLDYPLGQGRHGWLQVVAGLVVVNGSTELTAGDGLSISGEAGLTLTAGTPVPGHDSGKTEMLLFDLA